MRYECPRCKSMKKPKVIFYFPPFIVECVECKYKDIGTNFNKRDVNNFTPLPKMEH